jgi:hypothetical protein
VSEHKGIYTLDSTHTIPAKCVLKGLIIRGFPRQKDANGKPSVGILAVPAFLPFRGIVSYAV